MKNSCLASPLLGGLLLIACGSDRGAANPQPIPGPDPISPPVITSYQAGLQTSGAIGFSMAIDTKTRLEVSAPITPRTDILYAAEGPSYPSTPADEATVAHNAALTFKWLRSQCVTDYPSIAVPATDDMVLSTMQLGRNYNAVAECAYEKYTAKPYWIPQLVDDVDICATELGADWRLPMEADFADLRAADVDFLNSTWTDISSGSGSLPGENTWGSYYFSLQCYVRGTDGTLKLGDLSRGATQRVTDLGVPAGQATYHFEHNGNPLALRCVRRTKLS